MPKVVDEATIERIAQAIVAEIDPNAVYLFGSRAHGRETEEPDVDIAVAKGSDLGSGEARYRQLGRLYRATRGHGVAVDVLLYTRDEFDGWRDHPSHIIHDIATQGRLLYGGH